MITCRNCGAVYEDDAQCCPYCGGDNLRRAVREHKDQLDGYKREQEKWQKMPAVAAKKGMKLTVKLILIAVAAAVVLCLLGFVVKRGLVSAEQRNKRSAAAALEELYEKGDYAGIKEYLDKDYNGRVDSTLQKYEITATMERYVEYSDAPDEGELAWLITQNDPEFLTDIYNLGQVLLLCRECEQDDYKYGEEEAVLYYSEYVFEFLQTYYGLTEQAVSDIMDGQQDAESTEEQLILTLQESALASLKARSAE